MKTKISRNLIAVCGMNCRLCLAYKRKKNGCLGCKVKNGQILGHLNKCKMRNCKKAIDGKFQYCFSCESYPCKLIKHIDKRYSGKYNMSMIENLEFIKTSGIRSFLAKEEKKWACPACGQILCCHRPQCLLCGHKWHG